MKDKTRILSLVIALCFFVAFIGCPKKVVKKEEPISPPPPEEEIPPPPPPVERKLRTIYFDFDKSDIRPGDAEILKSNAAQLNESPDVKVTIEGHCCPIGTSEYNMALGWRRANSARDYLVKLGVSADRISTISYGEERPATTVPDEYPQNRRAEFVTQ